MAEREEWFAAGFEIAMAHGHRRLFVHASQKLRLGVATIVND